MGLVAIMECMACNVRWREPVSEDGTDEPLSPCPECRTSGAVIVADVVDEHEQ